MNEIHTCHTERNGGTNGFPRRRKGREGVSAQRWTVRWKWAERRRRDGSWLTDTSWSASRVSRHRQREQVGRWYLGGRGGVKGQRSKVRPGRWELISIRLFAFFIDSCGSLLSLQEHKQHSGRCESCGTISCEQSRWCKANKLSLIL